MKQPIVLSVSLLLCVASTSGGFHDDPVSYTALSGDLNVADATSPDVIGARILRSSDNVTAAEWKRTASATGDEAANVTFPCGAVSRAGTYTVQLKYAKQDDDWIDYRQLHVSWPPMLVQAPAELANYRSPFHVKIQWLHLKCYPPPESNVSASVQVAHCGRRAEYAANCSSPMVRSSQPLSDLLWAPGGIGVDVRFDCQALDLTGAYRVMVHANEQNESSLIGWSEPIAVDLNADFALQVRAKFARPCHSELAVFYRRPACMTGNQDRVRVYGKTYGSNASSDDFTLAYIGEKVLDPGRNVTSVPCRMLEDRIFDALCFRLASLAAGDGAVIDILQTCIAGQNTSVYEQPSWGSWSAFSSCTSQSCGHRGVRYRYRYCDQPPPAYPGSFCMGTPIEWENCETRPCDEHDHHPVQLDVFDNDQSKTNLTSDCGCGCSMELELGVFSLVASSSLCPESYFLWKFTVPSYRQIQLAFNYLRLDCHPDDRLIIRDGSSIYSPLIVLLGGEGSSEFPSSETLKADSSTMLLELNITKMRNSYRHSGCVAGFIATISLQPNDEFGEKDSRTSLAKYMSEYMSPPVWTMTSVISLVTGTVLVLVILYAKCGFHLKHDHFKMVMSRKRSDDSGSIWSHGTDYQLLSVTTATSLGSIDTLDDDSKHFFNANQYDLPSGLVHLMRMQQSLPSSPFIPRSNKRLKSLSRSSTMSPRFLRRQQQSFDKLRQWSLNNLTRRPIEDIEMVMMMPRTDSETTLREQNMLNTVCNQSMRTLTASTAGDRTSVTQSMLTQSCSAIFDPDQDLEFDYYDLDVRNAGCDAPDSFLRCLADDSTYWQEAGIDRPFSPRDIDSIDELTEGEISYADDA